MKLKTFINKSKKTIFSDELGAIKGGEEFSATDAQVSGFKSYLTEVKKDSGKK